MEVRRRGRLTPGGRRGPAQNVDYGTCGSDEAHMRSRPCFTAGQVGTTIEIPELLPHWPLQLVDRRLEAPAHETSRWAACFWSGDRAAPNRLRDGEVLGHERAGSIHQAPATGEVSLGLCSDVSPGPVAAVDVGEAGVSVEHGGS